MITDDELLSYFDRYGIQMFHWTNVAFASPKEREAMKHLAEEEQKMPKQHYSQHPRFGGIVDPFNFDDEEFDFDDEEINTPYPQNNSEIAQLRKRKLLIYVDCINETLNKYLGEGLRIDPRNFHDLAKDAERVEKAFGINMEDANIIAVVNFRQDIRVKAKAIPPLDDTLNPKYLDETAIKLLAKMSVKARKVMEEYWAEKFDWKPNT